MPFERYLRADDHTSPSYCYQDHAHACGSQHTHGYFPDTDHHHPHAVQFQIPQFMFNGPPILAPGGGAEVLPAGLLDCSPDSFASSWFAHNGFTPFHSALISKYTTSGLATDDPGVTRYHIVPPSSSQHLSPRFPLGCNARADSRQQPLPDSSPSLDASRTFPPGLNSTPPSTDSLSTTSYSPPNAAIPDSAPSVTLSLTGASSLSLPAYSASGFDILSILSRVANRPDPTIQLGPVDFSCSFVIVDVRRHDSPIVYASPTFCHLTGYSEQEVLGRNCRFLQSPTGHVSKGEPRRFASSDAVSYMRKLLSSSKECQTSLINYRKGGQAFVNLVSVIPLRGGIHNMPEEADEIAYHIGFQVDLTEQPGRILDKLRDGSYHTSSWEASAVSGNSGFSLGHGVGQLPQAQNLTNIGTKGGRHGQMMSIAVSKELRNLIADTAFTDSVPISTRTNMSSATNAPTEQSSSATMPLTTFVTPTPSSASTNRMATNGHMMAGSIPVSLSPSLSLLLLEFLPDFLLVLSLKGAFLYVAPSVRLVLGYEPEELVGRSISDVCHPADLVPLMRELKEGSVSGLSITGTCEAGPSVASSLIPKSVDLLFRALPKSSALSPSSQSQKVFDEQGDHPSQSLHAFTSQPSLSADASCSNDMPDGTSPYVWLECRGRLHVEPGKGRKAIILSARARWMPVVRWGSVNKAGSLDHSRRHGEDTFGGLHTSTDSNLNETSPSGASGAASLDPLEFWSLLSSQGTFLVTSASVRDVLGWGTSEVIGRSIWTMVIDTRSGIRERVEAELTKLDALESGLVVDPPPTVVTTSLAHRELHAVPVRLVFYRTPRSHKHMPSSTSSIGGAQMPLIHPSNNPLCPIVCHATVLSNTEGPSRSQVDTGTDPRPGHGLRCGDDRDELPVHHSSASLFEELETVRGSSWQYELQQLKFANQRLYEELHALETSKGTGPGPGGPSSRRTTTIGMCSVPYSHSSFASSTGGDGVAATVAAAQHRQVGQLQVHYNSMSLVPPAITEPSTIGTVSSAQPSNSLHERDPPSSEWSSLAGANGQGTNPLKRPWGSEGGSTM